jgi:FkbM family methyltransferase
MIKQFIAREYYLFKLRLKAREYYFFRLRSELKKLASRMFSTKQMDTPSLDWLEMKADGLKWKLNINHEIDKEIALQTFEVGTTDLIKKIVKPGMKILDIGANIGYYTTIFGKLVGDNGEVWAFEPVARYREQNLWHIQANHLQDHVHLFDFALSDKSETTEITIDRVSATMHHVSYDKRNILENEIIRLDTLDNVSEALALPKIDFIKMDTDGHEPYVLKGAKKFFEIHRPVMVIEFAQLWLDRANSDVRELKDILDSYGYTLFSQQSFKPFETRRDFLIECGNFNNGLNVWAVPAGKIHLLSDLF